MMMKGNDASADAKVVQRGLASQPRGMMKRTARRHDYVKWNAVTTHR
jgi:hypothetical protein